MALGRALCCAPVILHHLSPHPTRQTLHCRLVPYLLSGGTARVTLERIPNRLFTPGGRIPVRHASRWAWSVVLLAAAVVARADDAKPKDPPKDEAPKTAAEQYQALIKEFATARSEFSKAYQAAKTDEERQKVIEEKYPRPQKYAARFLELAKKNP